MLADNPLLERTDDPFSDALRIGPNGVVESQRPADAADRGRHDECRARGAQPATKRPGRRPKAMRGTTTTARTGAAIRNGAATDDDNDERSSPQIATTGRTLRDHLIGQLAATQCTPVDRALVGLLIDNLTDDGYLDASLDELAAMLPQELEIEPEALSTALSDAPELRAGRGRRARSLREPAAATGRTRGIPRPAAARTLELARGIASSHLQLLARRTSPGSSVVLRCDDDELREAQTLIRQLDPRPGAAFSIDEPTYVVPDVVVRRTRAGWQATLNPEVLPRLTHQRCLRPDPAPQPRLRRRRSRRSSRRRGG